MISRPKPPNKNINKKYEKNIVIGLFALALMASSAIAQLAPIPVVLVTTNTLVIPTKGLNLSLNSPKKPMTLGTSQLSWVALPGGKSTTNIVAALPPGLASGTYWLSLGNYGASVEIGSVNAEAGLANLIQTTVNSTSNSIITSLTKDSSVLTITSAQSITNNGNSYFVLTNDFVTIIGDTNAWVTTNNATTYTIPAAGVYEVSFNFTVSYAPDADNEIVVGQNNNYKAFSFQPVNSGYFTWSGKTTFQCSAGDIVGVGGLTSSGDPIICSPDPSNDELGIVPCMEVSIKQIQ